MVEFKYIYLIKNHPDGECWDKNYGVFYLSHKKKLVVIQGTQTSNKRLRSHWFWVDRGWLTEKNLVNFP